MARNECSPEQLESIAAELVRSSDLLKMVAAEMRSVEMPHMLLHSTMYLNVHLPATTEFAMKVQLDSISQLRAFTSGTVSRVETRMKYHASQKLADAHAADTSEPPPLAKRPNKKAAKKKVP